MLSNPDPLGHLPPGHPERVARAQRLIDAHWDASMVGARHEKVKNFKNLLEESGAYNGLGAIPVADQAEISVTKLPVKPVDRLTHTVERRKKFSAPGAHLEQEALAARISADERSARLLLDSSEIQ